MRIVIVGHVDHGKSTLVGRLLCDTDSLPDGKLEQVKKASEKRGMPFEWSFLLDSLQTERDQGITIDVTEVRFKSKKRSYTIIDAPGHKEFLKNMITGAASCEAAVLVIDCHEGVMEQSKKHAYLLSLIGVQKVIVCVNKMDAIGYNQDAFYNISEQFTKYLNDISIKPECIIPIAARDGDNIVTHSNNMQWYDGLTLIQALDALESKVGIKEENIPLRLPVQDIYKFDNRRIIAGRIESGTIKVGDEIVFSPSNKLNRVRTIEKYGKTDVNSASAGECIGITLEDQIFVERGDVISHISNAPFLTNVFKAKIFWLGDKPLQINQKYKVRIGTAEYQAEVTDIKSIIDTENLSEVNSSKQIPKGAIADIEIRVKGMAAVDCFYEITNTGRFVIVDGYDIAGGGIISLDGISNQRVNALANKSENIFATDLKISPEQREARNGHKRGVLWFTGLSGSGKSTLAIELQQRLFAKGMQVYVLDGDNMRSGLNSDLGFSHEDRAENIRRVGEVAALFADSGSIVITAFISPYREDRRRARAASAHHFHTIYVKADLKTCEERDPKGLYKKARKGEIKQFTGVSDIYEEPENPDLVLDTSIYSIEECVGMLIKYVEENFSK